MMPQNKAIILFLAKFFISYFLLVALYTIYLSKTQEKTNLYACSPITTTVAKQTVSMIEFLGYDAEIEQHQDELSIKILVNNKYVSKVIEGCNSISIIILFLAFIIAFSGRLLPTIIYGIVGSALIYVINIFRIAVISIEILKYPKYQEFFHGILFPVIIYGMVCLLWLIWVRKYATLNKKAFE
jgi:exosortase family protein XrtF